MKNLVIVESPSKAKTIEKFLGPEFKVMSSFGHIRDLKKKGMSVDIEGGFMPDYEIPADKKELVRKLKAAAKEADTVWLASDEDREGEAIAWHLYEVLKLKPSNTHRIVFHEITKPAILHAIANPRAIDTDMVNAQQARRVLDRIVGFELSPVLWRKIKPSLSAGRVQSVALRLVCEREREVTEFVPEAFWRLNALFNTPGGVPVKAESPRRAPDREEAAALLRACNGAEFKVTDIARRPVGRKPAPPFTTSTLQQEAGRKLGFSVSTTMRVAQQLYEEGHITYMRTDSTNLSELALGEIAKTVESLYGPSFLETRRYHTSSKGAQEAHEAIRPTYIAKRTIDAEPRQQKLYDLIWKRAVASQMADARLERTSATIEASDSPDAPQFKATGEVLVFEGFMKAYGAVSNDEDTADAGRLQAEGILPPMEKGEAMDTGWITATQRFTQPPGRYTEATLVKKMEELGIGRPSTYAPTITTLQNREYIVHGDHEGTPRDFEVLTLRDGEVTAMTRSENQGSNRGRLVPTDIGTVVNEYLTENFPDILDYGFTARIEEKFDDIAEGNLGWQAELGDFYGGFHPFIEKAGATRGEHKVGERILGNDPKTGKPVSVKIGRFGPMVQLGSTEGEEKPQFASLAEGQGMQTITLEEALKLFELPRRVGELEGKEITAAIGRFGPYVKYDGKFVSIPKEMSPYTLTEAEAAALIEAKRTEEANRLIKTFEELPGVEVLRGRFGPYIAHRPEGAKKAVNYKIPKGTDPETLTAAQVKELMEKPPSASKRKR